MLIKNQFVFFSLFYFCFLFLNCFNTLISWLCTFLFNHCPDHTNAKSHWASFIFQNKKNYLKETNCFFLCCFSLSLSLSFALALAFCIFTTLHQLPAHLGSLQSFYAALPFTKCFKLDLFTNKIKNKLKAKPIKLT